MKKVLLLLIMFTETQEDYIRAIYLFYIRNESRYPKIIELADILDKGRSTVSERLQDLDKKGLVLKEHYGELKLTERGMEVAEWLTWKHRVIEIFLHDILGLELDKIHEEAHKLEHAFSDEAIGKLYNFLKSIHKKDLFKDPHGQKLPEIKHKPFE